MARLCIFGDSIAWGHSDNKKGGWVELLKIYCLNHCDDLSVYNCSVSGDTSKEVMERFDVEYKHRNPETVIFAIGINDSQYFVKNKSKTHVDIKQFQRNMHTLIEKAKEKSRVAVLGLSTVNEKKVIPLPWRQEVAYDNEHIKIYNNVLEQVCKEESVLFIDVLNLLKLDDLDDGIHPNTKGHKKMFDEIKTVLVDKKVL